MYPATAQLHAALVQRELRNDLRVELISRLYDNVTWQKNKTERCGVQLGTTPHLTGTSAHSGA